jgi:putative transferase (TIGR04331 family)
MIGILIHNNIQIIQNKPKDKKELIEVYEYCNIIYKRLLQDLSLELNRLHDLKKSPESWEVIIGKWLLGFIYISHNNFKLCEKILSEEKLSSILMMDSDEYSLHTKETLDFFWATRDSDWNLSLNSKIINFLNLDIKKKIIKLEDNKFDKYKSTSNILFLLKKFFFNIFNKINNKNNILVYSTSLNIIQEKKIRVNSRPDSKILDKRRTKIY